MSNHESRGRGPEKKRYENDGPATGGQDRDEKKDDRMPYRQGGGTQDADVRQQELCSRKG